MFIYMGMDAGQMIFNMNHVPGCMGHVLGITMFTAGTITGNHIITGGGGNIIHRQLSGNEVYHFQNTESVDQRCGIIEIRSQESFVTTGNNGPENENTDKTSARSCGQG
jgi:hypothetical protein